MKRPCWACEEVLRTSRTILNGRCFLNLDGFAPAADWEEIEPRRSGDRPGGCP